MAIDTTKTVTRITYNGVALPLPSGGGADGVIIRTAELDGVDITLSKNGTIIETKNTGAGGVVDFSVSETGTYTLSTDFWSKEITITELGGLIVAGAGALDDYTEYEIHEACQGGYAKYMWKPKDQRTIEDSTSIYNNKKIMIAQIVTINGVDNIDWVLADKLSTSYNINPIFAYLSSASATSWSNNYSNAGGFKYSAMHQRCMMQNEGTFSQATGVLPSDYSGVLSDGIKINEFYYTDQNGATAEIYTYDPATDNFTLATEPNYSQTPLFMKGYFKSVGTIDEQTFNNGYYYTYNSSTYVYTRATAYASGTTYYGLYETIQEDGAFYNGLTIWKPYLVRLTRQASAGGTQTSYLSSFADYVSLPAVEEITGLYRGLTLPSGVAATSANAYNLAGEGEKQDGYDFSTQTTGNQYWTRSTHSNLAYYFCYISYNGNISNYGVYTTYGVRACFRTN